MKAQPSGGVSADYLHYDSDIHILTHKRSNQLRFRTVIRRLLRSWPARPGKGKRGVFSRDLTSRFIFSWHPFYTSVSACFFEA